MKKYLPIFLLTLAILLITQQTTVAAPEFQQSGRTHYVTWGESLDSIAVHYGVTTEAIIRQNGLTNPDFIYVGQMLIIPNLGYGQPGSGSSAWGCSYHHTVHPGESLSSIAWEYNTTVQALLQQNNIYNKDFVYVGQKLCISQDSYAPQPVTYRQPTQPQTYHYHTVAPGETLSTIAYRYGVNYWDIVRANNLSNASYIWSGQQLIIPGYQSSGYDHAHKPDYYNPPNYQHDGYKPRYDDHQPDYGDSGGVPPAPGYEAVEASVPLPRAKRPVEVVVNGGETWVGSVYSPQRDPDGITTLIVQTGEENGKTVRVRSGDAEVKGISEFTGEFGAYRFVFRYISPGDYDVWIDDPDVASQKAQVSVGAGERIEVNFKQGVAFQGQSFASPEGWILADWNNPSEPGKNIGGWSSILVRTPASGLWVIIESEGGYQAKCFTGSKGPNACEFAALGAGTYFIYIDGTDLKLKTYIDGNAHAEFTFGRQAN